MLKNRKKVVLVGIVILVIGLAIFAVLRTMPFFEDTKAPTKTTALNPSVQGLYESCPPAKGSVCLTHLDQMVGAGFKIVLNYDQFYGNEAQELAYAERARSLHMQIIWVMSDPAFWNGTHLPSYYSDLAATCKCSDNKGFIQYVVNLVKRLPATWGYYIGDEVKSSDHDKFKTFADLVRESDPSHPRLYISGENSSTMGSNLRPFADSAEVIGSDIYPVSTSESIESVSTISRAVQSIASQNGKQTVIVLQSFNWGQYPKEQWVCSPFPSCSHFPSADEMRHMRDLAVKNSHPQFILWYSYFDIFKSDNPTGHWQDLIDAASSPADGRQK